MDREEQGIEINLGHLIGKLFENIRYIVLATVIFAILAFFVSSFFVTPIYEANVKMIVNSRQGDTGTITKDQLNSAKDLVGTYAVIICGRDVINRVISELELQATYSQLANAITVKAVNDTPIMNIRIRHVDRNIAISIAEKIIEIAPEVLTETTAAGSVKPVDQAYADFYPVSPNVKKNTVFGALAGFVLSCLVIVVISLMDNTYKSDLDIQKDLDIAVLGVIPAVESCRGYVEYGKVEKGKKVG